MGNKNLIDKIKFLCKEGEEFSKGHYLVRDNIKFKYFHNKKNKNERIRVIEGQEKVFDYTKLKKYTKFYWSGDNSWEKIIDECYFLMNREY